MISLRHAPSHRYLWDPAVDRILADEQVATGSPNDIRADDRLAGDGPRRGDTTRRPMSPRSPITRSTKPLGKFILKAARRSTRSSASPAATSTTTWACRELEPPGMTSAVGRWLSEIRLVLPRAIRTCIGMWVIRRASATDPTGLWVWLGPDAQWWLDIPNPFAPAHHAHREARRLRLRLMSRRASRRTRKVTLNGTPDSNLLWHETQTSQQATRAAIDNYLEARWQMAPWIVRACGDRVFQSAIPNPASAERLVLSNAIGALSALACCEVAARHQKQVSGR